MTQPKKRQVYLNDLSDGYLILKQVHLCNTPTLFRGELSHLLHVVSSPITFTSSFMFVSGVKPSAPCGIIANHIHEFIYVCFGGYAICSMWYHRQSHSQVHLCLFRGLSHLLHVVSSPVTVDKDSLLTSYNI